MKLNSLNKESLREDNDKVFFLYTGLPHREIWFLFNLIKNSSSESKSSRGILNSFQKIFLGLIRMRLNLSGRDLGYSFGGISEVTASRTCSGCTVSSGLKGMPFVKLFHRILASTFHTVLSLSIALKYSWTAL